MVIVEGASLCSAKQNTLVSGRNTPVPDKNIVTRILLPRLGSRCLLLLLFIGWLCWSAGAYGIPPNTPITNVATVDYVVAGTPLNTGNSDVIVTDPGAGNSSPSTVSLTGYQISESLLPLTADVFVGDFVILDLDPGDGHSITVDDPRFNIVGTSLFLRTGAHIDFETEAVVPLLVTVIDSQSGALSQNLNLPVSDINEPPTEIILSSVTVTQNLPGAVVGDLQTTDVDANDIHTYTVDDPRFEVVNGSLKLVDGQTLSPGDVVPVTVTSTDSGGLATSQGFEISGVPPGVGVGDEAGLTLLQFAPAAAGAAVFSIQPTQCDAGAGLTDLPNPISIFGGQISIPGTVNLLPTTVVKSNDVLFLQLNDASANHDTGQIDQVRISLHDGVDQEHLVLAESGPNSGIFVGYVQTYLGPSQSGNCRLEVRRGGEVQVTYTDADNSLDVAVAQLLVDPFGVVFESSGGAPVDGVEVVLVHAATGAPAAVFDDDGITPVSPSQMTGDAELNLPAGAYRFPFVAADDYLLRITPPNRFAFPSRVQDAVLQTLPGAPYALGPGSRGESFTVPVGPAVRVDIPLDILPITPSASRIRTFAWREDGNPDPGGVQTVPAGQCISGANQTPNLTVASPSRGDIQLPARVLLGETSRIRGGEAVFIQLEDRDQDLDPFAQDQVEIHVTVNGGDTEHLVLNETNPSTGIFTGHLNTAASVTGSPNDCVLQADAGADVELRYTDPQDNNDQAVAEITVDPGFRVFSSINGSPVDGIRVTLVDPQTGLPASSSVFGRDGTSAFPATVEVGGEVRDAGGERYLFAPGGFYFPYITPGDYALQFDLEGTHQFPSDVPNSVLNTLSAGPFFLAPGSRGGTFSVRAGIPTGFDIPLDPLSGVLFVSKQASKDEVAIGDFLQYRIQIDNAASAASLARVELQDTLPEGFRYVEGSLQISRLDTSADSTQRPAAAVENTGGRLLVDVGAMNPGGQLELRYVAEVTAGAPKGVARNHVQVAAPGTGEPAEAFADVLVGDDLFSNKSFVVGRVLAGPCGGDDGAGVSGVRVWLEDGTFVVTDVDGRFHLEDLNPGTHVLQLDQATIPSDMAPQACETNTQFAGNPASQFIDLQPGTLWRSDFYLTKKPTRHSEVVSRLDAQALPESGRVRYRYHIIGGEVPLDRILATILLDTKLRYAPGSTRLNGLVKGDPSGADSGTLSFRLPQTQEAFEYVLEFDAFVKDPRGDIEVKGVVQLGNAGGRYRSGVVVNTLGLNWPASMVALNESVNELPRVEYANSAAKANRQALERARVTNRRGHPKLSAGEHTSAKVAINSGVYEPSRGEYRSRSATNRTTVRAAQQVVERQPYQLPQPDKGMPPPFDANWLAKNQQAGIVWPPEDYNPTMPVVAVAVVHHSDLRPHLLVDGKLVSPLSYEGTDRHPGSGMSITRWENVSISEADSVIEAQLQTAEGETRQRFTRGVHFSGAPAHAELVLQESYLVADGIYPPAVAVRLRDRHGYPLRAGTTGEFSVAQPYQPLDKSKHLENSGVSFNNYRYRVLRDGIAYIQLEPTIETGEVEIRFQFDQQREETIRARLRAGHRDWIMVGLVEGSYSRNSLSGNLKGLSANNLAENSVSDGRIAFYAKGTVKGDWLLTAAYDTDKKFERSLRQQIDPNRFYTLYGDGTGQLYDAQSQRKLFLKVEKKHFAALFGDFDTGFNQAELSRYERRVNGLQMGFYGDRVDVQGFASRTDQGFVRDEIQGNGTSGIYRLSGQQIVRNSETVRIVSRDRFSPDQIINERILSRYLDYTINFFSGELIFKQPVFSQDENFNPVFIEVEYEVAGPGIDNKLVGGLRTAYRLDKTQVGLSYVSDDSQSQAAELLGLDISHQVNDANTLSIEVAQSENGREVADAFLVELAHNSTRLAGRAFLHTQELGFGLGHQSALVDGTRRLGVEGAYRVKDNLSLHSEISRQNVLDNGAHRLLADVEGRLQLGRAHLSGGLRGISEETANGDELDAVQLLLGGQRSFWRDRVLLRSDLEVDVSSGGGNTDYPSRAILGTEYKLVDDVYLQLEQEMTWGSQRDTRDTRFGLRANPWTGGTVSTTLARQRGENAQRLFATTGLLQQFRLNDHWLLDVGLDQVKTLRSNGPNGAGLLFNPAQPAASGSVPGAFVQDFTALFGGFGYRRDVWHVDGRVEVHSGDEADRLNLLFGANRQLSAGRVISSSLAWFSEERENGDLQDQADLRLGMALRPDHGSWTLLNRTDLIFSRQRNSVFDTRSRKWVNNLNLNFKSRGDEQGIVGRHQLSLQLGLKYVLDNFDTQEFDGTTLLYGAQYRYNFHKRWDLGVHGSVLHSLRADVQRYSSGVSLGYNAFRDTWVSVGYNFVGFADRDFVAADYTSKGLFIRFRLKFDQALMKQFLAFANPGQQWRGAGANSR